jgi:hypothetical protein
LYGKLIRDPGGLAGMQIFGIGSAGHDYGHPGVPGYVVNFRGRGDQAMAVSEGLLAATPTGNPALACFALFAYGMARCEADPVATPRRSVAIAHETYNRLMESWAADALSALAARRGDPMDAFDYLTLVCPELPRLRQPHPCFPVL